MSVEQAQHQMSEPAGNSQHGRSAFAAQGRGKEAASVAFDVSVILVALSNTANYVLFASYMMHVSPTTFTVVLQGRPKLNVRKVHQKSLCHCQLIVKCMVILHVVVTEMRAVGYGLILHAGDCAHTGVCVTILPWRFRVTLLRVSRFKYGSESECTNSWLYCLNVSCELS